MKNFLPVSVKPVRRQLRKQKFVEGKAGQPLLKNASLGTILRLPVLLLLAVSLLLNGCSPLNVAVSPQPTGQQPAFDSSFPWQQVQPGLFYAQVRQPLHDQPLDFLVAKIDPKRFRLSLYENVDHEKAKTIREIHEQENSLLTFNGSFFGTDFKSIGLLISGGKTLHRLIQSDLSNGVFVVAKNGDATLKLATDFVANDQIDFALQNGPILLDETGTVKIASDTGKTASRTALGIDGDGQLILIILKQSLLDRENIISLYQFADLLKNNALFRTLQLHGVLNLDGGPSTGVMIGAEYFPEMELVQNVVIIRARQSISQISRKNLAEELALEAF